MSFSILPTELKLQIFSHLDTPSLLAMSCVSQECHSFTQDKSLENPLMDSQFFVNLQNKNFIHTETPTAYNYNQYLHIVDGMPTVSIVPPEAFGQPDFSAQIDSKTLFIKPPFATLQKKIKIGEIEYKLQSNTLYVDGEIKRHSVKDIACFHGTLIYLDQYRAGIYVLDPKSNDIWTEKRVKIADDIIINQIVCDDKEGIVYGLTEQSIVKLDYKNADPVAAQNKESTLAKTISYIGRLILKLLGNVFLTPIWLLKESWKVNAIVGTLSFVGGVALGFYLGAPSVLIAGLAIFILFEVPLNVSLISIGIFSGLGITISQIVTDKI